MRGNFLRSYPVLRFPVSTNKTLTSHPDSNRDIVSAIFSAIGNLSKKSSDVILAFLMMAIIGLMILPLPLVLIDTLVALNMALGVMLVLMAIYVNSPLQFSAFPSVLLISTLFRLALSIATTRLILLEGDAGNIIDTFGQMVAGGNIVVGLVVFLIITLVQFLVIAKGSERVAEVGARFTLDAMPGKQLSIDSDLRSGLIDKTEARKKRADLEKESQLHGSLDGAMKFVKGDAIAGIVVIIINLLGGLSIGVFQLDMSAGDAMDKYSILTIGDGLVAQIPALFGAMAAGLIVTRVSDTDSEQHLGNAIQQQFSAIPRVSLVAGVICLFFALVPGFPTTIFLVLGLILVFAGAMLVPAFNLVVRSYSAPAFDSVLQRKAQGNVSKVTNTNTMVVDPTDTSPITFRLPGAFAEAGGDRKLQMLMEHRLFSHQQQTGVPLPPVSFKWSQEESAKWQLDVFDVPVVSGEITFPENSEEISEAGILAIRKNITLFVGLEQTNRLLAKVSEYSPEVVKEVQRALSLQSLSVIVRNLVEEEVPINNLSVALEALVAASQQEKDLQNLTEYARMSLGRQLCHRYANEGVIDAACLSVELEESLLTMLRDNSNAGAAAISPQHSELVSHALDSAIISLNPSAVVVPVVLRKYTRMLLAEKHFETPVLSYPEIVKPFELNVLSRVGLAER